MLVPVISTCSVGITIQWIVQRSVDVDMLNAVKKNLAAHRQSKKKEKGLTVTALEKY